MSVGKGDDSFGGNSRLKFGTDLASPSGVVQMATGGMPGGVGGGLTAVTIWALWKVRACGPKKRADGKIDESPMRAPVCT